MIIVVDESIVEHIFYLNELLAEKRERLVSMKNYCRLHRRSYFFACLLNVEDIVWNSSKLVHHLGSC